MTDFSIAMNALIAMLETNSGLDKAPEKFADFVIGVAVAGIMAIVMVWGFKSLKNYNLALLIPIAAIGLVFLWLGGLSMEEWKALGEDFVEGVLGIKIGR